MLSTDLEHRFTHHPPKTIDTEALHARVRQGALALGHMINTNVPDCRELSLAITKLEEFVMWANAAIARQISGAQAPGKGAQG